MTWLAAIIRWLQRLPSIVPLVGVVVLILIAMQLAVSYEGTGRLIAGAASPESPYPSIPGYITGSSDNARPSDVSPRPPSRPVPVWALPPEVPASSITEVRTFQHILFRVSPRATPGERAAALRRARHALREVRRGVDFASLAARLSDDSVSAANGAYLEPAPWGAHVEQFDSAGWKLEQGGVSGIVETAFGFHIIRRP